VAAVAVVTEPLQGRDLEPVHLVDDNPLGGRRQSISLGKPVERIGCADGGQIPAQLACDEVGYRILSVT
jgi:hypothetical protein